MTRITAQDPQYKCGTAKLTKHYGCREFTISQRDIENIVLASVQTHIDILIDREELKFAKSQKSKLEEKNLERKIADDEKAADYLESSVTKIYKDFSDGKITQEVFLHNKETINDSVARKRSEIEKMIVRLQLLTDERVSAEQTLGELTPLLALDALTQDVVDLLVDKILVYNEKEIEIVWNGRFKALSC
jgi:hypothetical protein